MFVLSQNVEEFVQRDYKNTGKTAKSRGILLPRLRHIMISWIVGVICTEE